MPLFDFVGFFQCPFAAAGSVEEVAWDDYAGGGRPCQHTDSTGKSPSTHRLGQIHHHPGMGFLKFPAASPGISRALQKLKMSMFLTKRCTDCYTKVHWYAAFPFHSMKCEWIDSLTSYPCHKQSTRDLIWWLLFKCSQQFASRHVNFGKVAVFSMFIPFKGTFEDDFFLSSCGIC